MSETSAGLFKAYLLDGNGGGQEITWEQVLAWAPEQGHLWVHLSAVDQVAQEWLREASGIEEVACDALLADETRPRTVTMDGGLLMILRGVNLNPGADPEDMVSLRLWQDSDRMISLSRRGVRAVGDLAAELERGTGAVHSVDLMTSLAGHLLERMSPVIEEMSETVDTQEEKAITEPPSELQSELAELRRQVIALRRHLAPQREAMARLAMLSIPYLDVEQQTVAQHLSDQVSRYVEDLDQLRERTTVTHDLLASRQAELMNRQMLILSLVAAIFLPLGLITGLLGINVGGIPGADNPWAFLVVCGLLIGLAGLLFLAFRRSRWL
jgi:zinc transporter